MKAYNANPSTCKEYWGHLGRAWNTRYSNAPNIFQLFVLGFALFFFVKGFFICVYHKYTTWPIKNGFKPTLLDWERLRRITRLKEAFVMSALPLLIFLVAYTVHGVLSILRLWLSRAKS